MLFTVGEGSEEKRGVNTSAEKKKGGGGVCKFRQKKRTKEAKGLFGGGNMFTEYKK